MSGPDLAIAPRSIELVVGRVLWIGTMASSICLGAGLVVALVNGDSGLSRWLLDVGLVILLATPAARVAVSIVDYARERDWLFSMLTLIVLLELAASVVAAVYGAVGR